MEAATLLEPDVPTHGVWVDVYRHAGGSDCTGGGVSGTATELTVVGAIRTHVVRGVTVYGPLIPTDALIAGPAPHPSDSGAPSVVLITADWNWYLVPWDLRHSAPEGWVGPMHGGNHATTCDARWAEFLRAAGVPEHVTILRIHDRIDTIEAHRSLSC